MKRIFGIGVGVLLLLLLTGCRESHRVSYNVSREADAFEICLSQ